MKPEMTNSVFSDKEQLLYFTAIDAELNAFVTNIKSHHQWREEKVFLLLDLPKCSVC